MQPAPAGSTAAPAPMREPLVAVGSQPVAEAANLPRGDSQRVTGLVLRELLGEYSANHMDSPEFAPPS